MPACPPPTPPSTNYNPAHDVNDSLINRKRRSDEAESPDCQLPCKQRCGGINKELFELIKNSPLIQQYLLAQMRSATQTSHEQPTPPLSPDLIEIPQPLSVPCDPMAPSITPRRESLSSHQKARSEDRRMHAVPPAPLASPVDVYLRQFVALPMQQQLFLLASQKNNFPPAFILALCQHYQVGPLAPPRHASLASAVVTRPSVIVAPPARNEPVADERTDDDVLFHVVNSYLQLNCKRPLKVTVGEIRRRMGAPEKQDWKMIARLIKSNNASFTTMQRLMCQAGIDIDGPIRTDGPQSTIQMLLEDDAALLAKGFRIILSSEMKSQSVAAIVVAGASDEQLKDLRNHKESIKQLLSFAKIHMFRAGRVPGFIPVTEDSATRAVNRFALQTHGFGPQVVVAVLDQLVTALDAVSVAKNYLEEALTPFAEERKPSLPMNKDCDDILIDVPLITPRLGDERVFGHIGVPRIGYQPEPLAVTVGELRRRALGPEQMNCSALNQFLRKTKERGTNANLRAELAKHGIYVEEGQKKMPPTAWMSLTEREAMALCRETGSFLVRVPPSEEMTQWTRDNEQAASSLRYIAHTVQEAMLKVGVKPAEMKVETKADARILQFAMISHHFGHSFVAFVMLWLQKALSQSHC